MKCPKCKSENVKRTITKDTDTMKRGYDTCEDCGDKTQWAEAKLDPKKLKVYK